MSDERIDDIERRVRQLEGVHRNRAGVGSTREKPNRDTEVESLKSDLRRVRRKKNEARDKLAKARERIRSMELDIANKPSRDLRIQSLELDLRRARERVDELVRLRGAKPNRDMEVDALKSELSNARIKLSKVQGDLMSANAVTLENRDLKRRLEGAKSEIVNLKRQLRDAPAEIVNMRGVLVEVRGELSSASERITNFLARKSVTDEEVE